MLRRASSTICCSSVFCLSDTSFNTSVDWLWGFGGVADAVELLGSDANMAVKSESRSEDRIMIAFPIEIVLFLNSCS